MTVGESESGALRHRLVSPMPDDRPWGWLGPLLVTAFGGFLRFSRLQVPRAISFDETYYAKDAWSILQHGVEWKYVSPPGNPNLANQLIIAGHTTGLFAPCSGTGCGEYVVQPEVGKLMIAIGEALFGLNSLGWRFSSAVFGTVAILLVCRIARRMTRSTLLGCIAGLLMSLDGLEFVLSRIGILDIFLMTFVLAAFGCLVIDRDVSRDRLAGLVARGDGSWRPRSSSTRTGGATSGTGWAATAGSEGAGLPGAATPSATPVTYVPQARISSGLVRRPAMIPGRVARRNRGGFARDRKVRR